MHRATSDDVYTQAWFDYSLFICLPTICERTRANVELFNVSTYQCSILSVHARIHSTGYVHLLWESSGEEYEFSHAAIFEVKFGKKSEKSNHRFAMANS